MTKFKPQYILDEQMYLADTQNALLYQIREEAKETNRLLSKLVEQKAGESQPPKEPEESKLKLDKKAKKDKSE